MLVLSRKKDESIVINNDITIVVVEIRGDKVRLGVEAPKEVPVHRREVFDAIARGDDATGLPVAVRTDIQHLVVEIGSPPSAEGGPAARDDGRTGGGPQDGDAPTTARSRQDIPAADRGSLRCGQAETGPGGPQG